MFVSLRNDASGHTPRPSKIQNNFVGGMRAVDENKLKTAEQKLQAAVAEAQEICKKNEGGTKADQEKMAYSCMGLGYVYVCAGSYDPAATLYKKSLQVDSMWEHRLHTNGNGNVMVGL